MTICDKCYRYGSDGEVERACAYNKCKGTMKKPTRYEYNSPVLNGQIITSSQYSVSLTKKKRRSVDRGIHPIKG